MVWASIPLVIAVMAGRQAAPLPVLTDIRAIRALSQAEAARGYAVHIRGIITHYDELRSTRLFIFDGSSGQFIQAAPGGSLVAWGPIRNGDTIEITGHTIRGGYAPNVVPDEIRNFGAIVRPTPLVVPYGALLTGRHDCEYVEVTGVIRRTWLASGPEPQTMFAEMAIEGGVIRTAFWDHHTGDLERFIDARVRVRGNVGAIFSPAEQLVGVSLLGGRTSDVQVLEKSAEAFSLPQQPIGNIFTYSYASEANRRILIRGVVVGAVPGRAVSVNDFSSGSVFRSIRHVLYLKDATGSATVETEQTSPVAPGDVVEAAGFPAVSPGKPVLHDAVYRVVGSESIPMPIRVPAGATMRADNDAELVRVDAQLLGVLWTPAERVLVLKSSTGDTAFEAALDNGHDAAETLDQIRAGSAVTVTGVYSYQAGPPPSFRLILRTPADIVVTASAPWWTPRHTAVLVGMLMLAAIAAIVILKMMTARERREYQAVLTERNRVARELHDTLEQGLTGISLQLEAVATTAQSSPAAARQSLDVARQMLRYSLEETRRSVMDLRSQALESDDLPAALSTLAHQMTAGTPIDAEVRVEGQRRRLDAALEHHLLRIGLEAVTNAVKHSGAAHVEILVRFSPSATAMVVADDGCGLHQEIETGVGHFGLQGMRERANKIGAVLAIENGPRGGTRISVSVPAAASAARVPTLVHDAAGLGVTETNHG